MDFLLKERPWKQVAGAALLMVFLAFGWSLTQGFAPIDDAFLIARNLAVRGITRETLRLAFTTYDPELYVPLTILSFQINYLIAGIHPWIYHLTSLLLHAGNAVLVMLLLSRLTGNRIVSVAAGLLFAVHPLHTEAVVWAAGRKDLLSTFFALLSAILFLHSHDPHHGKRAYALSILAFGFALLSKITPFPLPAVFALHEILVRRRKDRLRIVLEQIPYVTIAGVLLAVAVGGKEQVITQAQWSETLLLSIKSTMFSLQKIMLPTGLSVFYPYPGTVEITDTGIWVPLIALAIVLAGVLRYGRSNPLVLLGFLMFLLLLSPAFLHFRRAGDLYFAVDRYVYLPSVGIFLWIALIIRRCLERFRPSTVSSGFLILLLTGTALSIRQTTVWNSPQSLFTHALELYPNATRARTNLARALRRERKMQEAYDLLQEGIRVADAMELHEQLGYLYAETGDVRKAREEFLRARDRKPGDPNPLYDLASLAEQTGQHEAAIEGYRTVIALDPSFVIARVHLAKLLRVIKNDPAGAEQEILEALRWNPNSVEAHMEYADVLMAQGRPEEADRERSVARSINDTGMH